jgi:regulator of sigma E protease
MIIITILLFIFVLLINVLFHEWGHFFVARKMGMKVEEFGFGIPPRLYAWKRGETEYSINALPIGGFVKIPGENGEVGDGRGFADKAWYKQAFVLIAGVLANFVLAIVLFSIAFMIGIPSLKENGTPTILSVVHDSAADRAGLEVNDTVISIKNLTMGTVYTDLTTD